MTSKVITEQHVSYGTLLFIMFMDGFWVSCKVPIASFEGKDSVLSSAIAVNRWGG